MIEYLAVLLLQTRFPFNSLSVIKDNKGKHNTQHLLRAICRPLFQNRPRIGPALRGKTNDDPHTLLRSFNPNLTRRRGTWPALA